MTILSIVGKRDASSGTGPTLFHTFHCSNHCTEVSVMTEEVMRKHESRAIWLGIIICLVPLVPYALHGAGG